MSAAKRANVHQPSPDDVSYQTLCDKQPPFSRRILDFLYAIPARYIYVCSFYHDFKGVGSLLIRGCSEINKQAMSQILILVNLAGDS